MKRFIPIAAKLLFTMVLISLGNADLFGQPNDSAVFEEVTDTPINAGLALMAVAGLGYGIQQLRLRKK